MRFCLALLLAVVASAERIEFLALKEEVLQERLRLAHPKNRERFARLKALFDETGCRGEAIREQKVPQSKEPNLICAVAGSGGSSRKIIVGAHFDAIGGDGVIDNWSGAVLLPSLSEFIRRSPRKHDFEFVGFAAEEKGLLGSREYMRKIPKEDRKNVAAVVALDSLGLGPVKSWPNGSTKEMIAAGSTVAHSLGLSLNGVNVDAVGTTDSQVFKDARMPVLSLHSVTQETWAIINSGSDVWKAVSWQDYYDTHRFVSALLVYLDQTLE